MVSMTSLCDGIHTISTNKIEGNAHPLLRRVNKIALAKKPSSLKVPVPHAIFWPSSCCPVPLRFSFFKYLFADSQDKTFSHNTSPLILKNKYLFLLAEQFLAIILSSLVDTIN
ncbi:hypothetical protein RHMOL_Rhmol04G0180900 [Rhododendron molle]|uniref:Uncharacterized protein n=1 Tax=Rhododendron molle TaxID=49168 RepID=A0ACC0P3H7_RHOML|nr:hypothetical protein RHMOL_Rhmol04G0180900 [Rhododendron molle]